jgi:hypothetical protein
MRGLYTAVLIALLVCQVVDGKAADNQAAQTAYQSGVQLETAKNYRDALSFSKPALRRTLLMGCLGKKWGIAITAWVIKPMPSNATTAISN